MGFNLVKVARIKGSQAYAVTRRDPPWNSRGPETSGLLAGRMGLPDGVAGEASLA